MHRRFPTAPAKLLFALTCAAALAARSPAEEPARADGAGGAVEADGAGSVAAADGAAPFRLVVIPDTQFASQKWPHLIASMSRWILAQRDALDIRYVLHVGDMVQNGHIEDEWRNFDAGVTPLIGSVPTILAVGNHDFDKIAHPRGTELFNRYFPRARFESLAGFGDTYPQGTNDNSWHTFAAGGSDWIILSLIFDPTPDVLAWANGVLQEHPLHRAIVLTHSYLKNTGRDVTGEKIWTGLVERHPNVDMVICGHLSTVHFQSVSSRGRPVYEMLFDWQNDKTPEPNSFLAILSIDPVRGRIDVETYSPELDLRKEDPKSRFSFEGVPLAPRRAAAGPVRVWRF